MNTPWRADHVGSLLRPADLIEARRNGSDPEISRELEDKHILRVLAKQRDLGFGIFTDGELRRQNFMSDFVDAVDGFDTADAVSRSWDSGQGDATPNQQRYRHSDCEAVPAAIDDSPRSRVPPESQPRAD
jgi:5-methyltetrahydropteroyltriglutamate--homocysteine methyltransferase